MKDKNHKLEAIFHAAKDLSDPAQREIYLRDACRDEPSLRSKVEALLEAAADADALFGGQTVDSSPSNPTIGDTPLSESPGTKIGRYKLLQQIGEGGMGVVYMAEQSEPVNRKVALKII